MKLYFRSLVFLAFLTGLGCPAQQWAKVALEGADASTAPVVVLPAGTTYRVGDTANNLWSPSVTVTAPTTITFFFPTAGFTFPDPDFGQVKELDVQPTAAGQMLTVNGQPYPVAPLVHTCALPTVSPNINPTIPAIPSSCSLPTNAVKLCDDTCAVTIISVASPVYTIYCVGEGSATVCDAPQMFISDPIKVGPNARAGGPPIFGSTQRGSLYAIPSPRTYTVTFVDPALVVHPLQTIPAQ